MMKKAKQIRQTRKNNQNFFKHVQTSKPNFNQSKTHTRSMIDLDQNMRYQQSAREVSQSNKQNHHLSIGNQPDETEGKSSSLKKFLSLFGTSTKLFSNQSGNSARMSLPKQEKQSSKGSGRQTFTCNIKNMNVNMNQSNSRDKDIQPQFRTSLPLKKQKVQPFSDTLDKLNQEKNRLFRQLNEARYRNTQILDKNTLLQNENLTLKRQIRGLKQDRMICEEKFSLKQRELQRKIDQMQRRLGKQRCRQHQLIIQSLKKVINQQLRKIIELQKSKVERQQIQKLQERINKNMTIQSRETAIKGKLIMIENKTNTNVRDIEAIKIAEDSFNESALTSREDNSQFQMIEQASENEEYSSSKVQEASEQKSRRNIQEPSLDDGDSILEEVDKYLVQWRSKY